MADNENKETKSTNAEDIKKSIEAVVDEYLASLNESETPVVEASKEASTQEVITEPVQKAKDEEEKEDESEEKDEAKKAKKKDMKVKKSIDELKDILTEDELELVKAWRDEESKEVEQTEIAKSNEAANDISKSIENLIKSEMSELKKAMDQKDELIKSLNEKVEAISKQPAYHKRSMTDLETVEKSGAETAPKISKNQVLDKMLDLQLGNKGVKTEHIAEFESTENISNPYIKELVFNALKERK